MFSKKTYSAWRLHENTTVRITIKAAKTPTTIPMATGTGSFAKYQSITTEDLNNKLEIHRIYFIRENASKKDKQGNHIQWWKHDVVQ